MHTPRTVLTLSAKDTAPLRLDEELREVKEGLIKRAKLRDNLFPVSGPAVSSCDMQKVLLDHQPYIIHFLGHGSGAKKL